MLYSPKVATRVLKSSLRIKAIGAVDSCNASIGVAVLYLQTLSKETFYRIQNDLFDLGADLCLPNSEKKLVLVPQQVTWLEQQIDLLNEKLSPLKSFILPGGTVAAAHLHQARTSVRFAESLCVDLSQEEAVSSEVIQYLNRLSDYLFVAGRIENDFGEKDILWVPAQNQQKNQDV